jgi:hypothetical protein
VPALKELLSLVDPTRAFPAIDPTFGEVPAHAAFYTSSPEPHSQDSTFVVEFDRGSSEADRLAKTVSTIVDPGLHDDFYVRCVR